MNPYLQNILHNITVRLTKLEEGQKHEWVGLTDEDLDNCESEEDVQFARYIEAKLKEKNHGSN